MNRYGRSGAAPFYSKQATPNPELTIFAQAFALILYASSGENLHPPPRPQNRLRQEKPIPVFYFGMGPAVKKHRGTTGRRFRISTTMKRVSV
ncbi:MAG: hypothetical protein ACLVB5_02050 [Christensenellales bacterium]